MSNVVFYKDGNIAFCKDVIKASYTMIQVPLANWVCKLGLIMPVSTSSYNAVRTFDGLVTGIPGQSIAVNGLLLRLDGSVCQFQMDTVLGVHDLEKHRFTYDLPMGQGVVWAASEFESYEEKAYAALMACDTLEEVLPLVVDMDMIMGKCLKWYNVEELVKTVTEIHKTKYPELHKEKKDGVQSAQ